MLAISIPPTVRTTVGGLFIYPYTIDFRSIKERTDKVNNFLRKECKLLKVMQNVSYKELAEYLEIRQDSFYSWLKGYYNFSQKKQRQLKAIIEDLKES